MYKDVLKNIEGIEMYPLISLAIFFLFFVSLLLYIIKVDKKFVDSMKQMPLVSDEDLSRTQKQ
jgi:amino acid permease